MTVAVACATIAILEQQRATDDEIERVAHEAPTPPLGTRVADAPPIEPAGYRTNAVPPSREDPTPATSEVSDFDSEWRSLVLTHQPNGTARATFKFRTYLGKAGDSGQYDQWSEWEAGEAFILPHQSVKAELFGQLRNVARQRREARELVAGSAPEVEKRAARKLFSGVM